MAQIILTEEECIDFFYRALCNAVGTGYIYEHGVRLKWSDDEYSKSKETLLLASNNSLCIEDIWIQMLKDGYSLTILDEEGEGAEDSTITLSDVIEKVPKTPMQHLVDMIYENDDATTADVILQNVFYGEVIFG